MPDENFEAFCRASGVDLSLENSTEVAFLRSLWNEAKRKAYEEAAQLVDSYASKKQQEMADKWHEIDDCKAMGFSGNVVAAHSLAIDIRTLKDSLIEETVSSK